jgi:hypothetical protein
LIAVPVVHPLAYIAGLYIRVPKASADVRLSGPFVMGYLRSNTGLFP